SSPPGPWAEGHCPAAGSPPAPSSTGPTSSISPPTAEHHLAPLLHGLRHSHRRRQPGLRAAPLVEHHGGVAVEAGLQPGGVEAGPGRRVADLRGVWIARPDRTGAAMAEDERALDARIHP